MAITKIQITHQPDEEDKVFCDSVTIIGYARTDTGGLSKSTIKELRISCDIIAKRINENIDMHAKYGIKKTGGDCLAPGMQEIRILLREALSVTRQS